MNLRSKPEVLEAYAEQCTRLAAAARDRQLKRLFSDLADQWRKLAATTRLLKADSKAMDDFFARQVLSPMTFAALTEISTK
jgi:hypothetical protein